MPKIKFIHTADLHLDTPFTGLSEWNEDLADRLKDATFSSFQNIIDLAIRENIDFLVISGDIFDSEDQSLSAQRKFISELKRLSNQNISTYFICGNHDPINSWLDSLDLPDSVYRFGSKLEKKTYKKDGEDMVDIHGVSFANSVVEENLAQEYEVANDPATVSIALLHGTLGTSSEHENYAPFSMDDIAAKKFDYWALGHIHKKEVARESGPAVVYSGNPQGRDFGETGSKGCFLVEIDGQNNLDYNFKPTQEVRFERIEIDLSDTEKLNDLLEKIEQPEQFIDNYTDTSYMLRITITGRTALHHKLNQPGEIDQLMQDLNAGQLEKNQFTWIDSIKVKTKPDIDLQQVQKGDNFPAEVLRYMQNFEQDDQKLDELIEEVRGDLKSSKAKKELEKLTQEEKQEILNDSKMLLLDKLLTEES